MRIVDAQIHLWGSGLPSNMAHRQVTSFTTEEAVGLMDEGGVDAAVIHPPGWDPNSTEMAFKAVRDFPGRFAILGSFPLNQPDKRALVEKCGGLRAAQQIFWGGGDDAAGPFGLWWPWGDGTTVSLRIGLHDVDVPKERYPRLRDVFGIPQAPGG